MKGILKEDSNGRMVIFSPLFSQYIQKGKPAIGARITIEQTTHTVSRDGVRIADLSKQEYRLLEFFIHNRRRVCSYDEIAEALFPEEKIYAREGGIEDNRIQAAIKRLREKIEPDPKNPEFIITKSGHGYIFMDGEAPGKEAT